VKYHILISGHDRDYRVERPGFWKGYSVVPRALTCPQCLDVWCTIIPEDNESPSCHDVVPATCVHCTAASRWMYPVPGSIINDWTGLGGWDDDLLEALPEDLVKREFELTLKAWETIWIKRSQETKASSAA
jgi:hypothetical protein